MLLGKSITRQKSLLRNLYFLPGQYSWVATIHTNTMLGYWSVGMYIRVGGLSTNIDPPGTTKIPPSYQNLSTIVFITVTSTGYYV